MFCELRASGATLKVISDSLDISYSTCKKLNKLIKPTKEEQTEDIRAAYHIARLRRADRIRTELDKICGELDSRDYSDTPTKDLLILKLRYEQALSVYDESEAKAYSVASGTLDELKQAYKELLTATAEKRISSTDSKTQIAILNSMLQINQSEAKEW